MHPRELIAGLEINSLSWAEDLVLMSSMATGLQRCLNKLEKYCYKWSLDVNKSKTKCMVFRSLGSNIKEPQFTYKGHLLEMVDVFTYHAILDILVWLATPTFLTVFVQLIHGINTRYTCVTSNPCLCNSHISDCVCAYTAHMWLTAWTKDAFMWLHVWSHAYGTNVSWTEEKCNYEPSLCDLQHEQKTH